MPSATARIAGAPCVPCGVDDSVQVTAGPTVALHGDQALAEARDALLLADRVGRQQRLLRQVQK